MSTKKAMPLNERRQNYWRQNGTQDVTPKQARRLKHKEGTSISKRVLMSLAKKKV
jgi:hypothetical protein